MPRPKGSRNRKKVFRGRRKLNMPKRYGAGAQVPRLRIPRALKAISNTRNVTLKFSEYRSNNPTGTMDDWKYSWTNVYDPYQPTGGGSAIYFTEMTASYNHWTVVGAKMKITLCQTNSVPVFFSAHTSAGTTTQTDWQVVEMRDHTTSRILGAEGKPTTIIQSFNPKKFFGQSWAAGSSLYRGTGNGTSAPAENAYCHVCVQALDQASTPTYVLKVQIDYLVHFNEPIDQS